MERVTDLISQGFDRSSKVVWNTPPWSSCGRSLLDALRDLPTEIKTVGLIQMTDGVILISQNPQLKACGDIVLIK